MTSFHVVRESASAKDFRWRREQAEHHARHASLRDTFHIPFPASATEYVRRHGSQSNTHPFHDEATGGVLSKLPLEVLDLIFSKLPPAALATARCTCRVWWTTIMSNRWILASVLDCEHWLPGGIGQRNEIQEARLRLLQRELDRQQAICSDDNQPNNWLLRFRRRIIHFAVPRVCKHAHQRYPMLKSRFVSVDFASTGRFVVLRVANSFGPAATSQQVHHVVFYQVAYSGEPLYVGCLPCPPNNGFLSITRVIEALPNKSWSLTINIDGIGRSYSIIPRRAYAKTDAPFDLEEQNTESIQGPGAGESKLVNESCNFLATPHKKWQILAYLPYTTVSTRDSPTLQPINLMHECKSDTFGHRAMLVDVSDTSHWPSTACLPPFGL